MFEAVRGGKTALRSLINQWIEEYKADPTKAMLDMIQFIVDSSGCKSMPLIIIVIVVIYLNAIGKITSEMFEEMKYSEIISLLTKNFAEESGDYPLIINTTAYKRFKVTTHCRHEVVSVMWCLEQLHRVCGEVN